MQGSICSFVFSLRCFCIVSNFNNRTLFLYLARTPRHQHHRCFQFCINTSCSWLADWYILWSSGVLKKRLYVKALGFQGFNNHNGAVHWSWLGICTAYLVGVQVSKFSLWTILNIFLIATYPSCKNHHFAHKLTDSEWCPALRLKCRPTTKYGTS